MTERIINPFNGKFQSTKTKTKRTGNESEAKKIRLLVTTKTPSEMSIAILLCVISLSNNTVTTLLESNEIEKPLLLQVSFSFEFAVGCLKLGVQFGTDEVVRAVENVLHLHCDVS